ncbi:tyrosine-type recombinase/integrase [Janthinobacterium sp. PAMC25594]|uniref:tyrosine-type recombinase/integrase n=1 Tax=Janthinobacterium sp. PAMC25594 TaxID=2861284 RepID=UPI001C627EF7|nr:tyrosine-type recombinase/integrase [Janthinobacterium sp. PAMC25594]QYG06812.1 tyrosine-type recombinase/integrase [Janthinobacterium sp. PAMC25594]
MKLFFTDQTFCVGGGSSPDIPFLVDDYCELVNIANDYLLYVAAERGATRSPKTWRNHGEAMYDYFSWLEANSRQWNEDTRSAVTGQRISPLASYRNWSMALVSEGAGLRKLKYSTINQRLTCLIGFYRWAKKRGLIEDVPWDSELHKAPEGHTDFLRHTHGARYVEKDDVRLKVFKEPPKLLSLDQSRILLSRCRTPTLRLMTILMLQSGLRNEECRTFPRKYVIDPTGLNYRKRIRIDLSPSDMDLKNSRPRTVFVTWQLMRELFDYLNFGEGARRANLRWQKAKTTQHSVFLNKFGNDFSEKALNNAYRQLNTGRLALTFKVTPHMLRHTFATLELYHQSTRMPTAQALAWVRDRLGHNSLQTTSVYLHCIELMDDNELNDYQVQLDTMISRSADT